MEPEAKYTFVGAAVLVFLALVVAAVVWLRGSGEGSGARQYKIYFARESLEGLESRSGVTMRGVRVGSVTELRFAPQRSGVVEVLIAVDPTAPVRESTRATVERHLVTGLASVHLANRTEDSPPLVKAPPGEPLPVIAEGDSSFQLQKVSEAMNQLARRTEETMRQLNTTLAKADATLGSMGKAADEVRALAGSLAADARTLTARYDRLGADAGVSMREVGEAAKKMSADVERLSRRADALLGTSDAELRSTAQALRSAADAVGAAAARLRDPRQVIYGPAQGELGPGEGRR